MYLTIFDDGEIGTVTEIREGDAEAVEAGLMDVIRFEEGKYQRWVPGGEPEWRDI